MKSVAPGASFDVAIAYELAEGWHIYWKNPGEVGQAPKIIWQMPPGFKAEPVRFPMPSRYESGPEDFRLVNYIHEGKPVLLTTLTAPDDLKVGETLTIAAKVDSLVCAKNCV
ncbi:MAG: hypothetical protein GY778_29160, partial [bacterium]|nr:hypothetical protein [bacterium]